MKGFLGVVLKGLLCTVLLPVILLVWVLYGIYCIFVFIFMLFKNMIMFFKGESLSGDLKEDIEAKRMLLEAEQEQNNAQNVLNNMFQSTLAQMQAQGAFNQQPINQQVVQPEPIQNQTEPTMNFETSEPNQEQETVEESSEINNEEINEEKADV